MKVVKILRSKKGFSAPWTVVIAISALMFFVVAWQFLRLMTIAAGVKDAVQSAVISTSVGITGMYTTGFASAIPAGIGCPGIRGKRLFQREIFTADWTIFSVCRSRVQSTSN